uniref:Uncharacterized protein n=1 Tax=Pseudo-nitzschia australis TaxID=44445 RepID=A0A7S4AP71_9STRA
MRTTGRRPRALNPAFAAAHGIDNASDANGVGDGESGNGNSHSNSSSNSNGNNSIEIVLKRARDTGKLIASNCAGLKNITQNNSSRPLPDEFFAFPFHLSQYTEELLTVVDFSDNQEHLVVGSAEEKHPELDERILRYQSAQSMRFRNCDWKLPANLSFSSLEHLAILDLSGNRLEGGLDVGFLFWSPSKTSALVELNLSNNRIRALKATRTNNQSSSSLSIAVGLPKLRSLDVSHNPPLESLFEGDDFSCENLRIFRCHHNPNLRFLSSIPASTTMDGIPPFLRSATATLEVLDASHNPKIAAATTTKTQTCRIDLSDFTQLQTVSFAMNKLDAVPCIPPSVKSLDLRSNKLASISAIFPTESDSSSSTAKRKATSQLVELILADNYLVRLDPLVLKEMTRLKRLDLISNKLLSLPYQLGFLTEIMFLDVSGNPVATRFPSSVVSNSSGGNPQALLELLRNQAPVAREGSKRTADISSLLATALSTKGRTTLDLEGKLKLHGSDALEGVIGELLKSNASIDNGITGQLILDSNQLDSLPEDLLSRCLPNVQAVSLIGNNFVELPTSLQNSRSRIVNTLRLGKNPLTSEALVKAGWFQPIVSTPTVLSVLSCWSLQSLTHLDLSSNRLTSFPIETSSEVHCFPTLEILNLFDNRIDTVENWKSLPDSLTTLELSENRIEDIDTLPILLSANCPGFQRLSLLHNRIKRIPASLGLLATYSPTMVSLNLQGNPQRAVPPDVLERPCQDLLKYLSNRLTVDQRNTAIAHIQMQQHRQKQQKEQQSHQLPEIKPIGAITVAVGGATVLPSDASSGENSPLPHGIQKQESLPDKTTESNRHGASDGGADPQEDDDDNNNDDTKFLKELQESVEKLKAELENLSLTQAKKYAVKKSLAMERSKLIREERRLGLRK